MDPSSEVSSYAKKEAPRTPQEWKEHKMQQKEKRRLINEKKAMKQMKQAQTQKEEVAAKKRKTEEVCTKKVSTVSIALPGSILDNAQTDVLKTMLAGQIARAAACFNVDEIVVFDETNTLTTTKEGEPIFGPLTRSCEALMQILQYMECPQYLRKLLFPVSRHLKFAGLLPPLDCPHHLREDETCRFREGVVLNKPAKEGRAYVNIGLKKECRIDRTLPANTRVTVELGGSTEGDGPKNHKGTIVSPDTPRQSEALYWGYRVRLASSLGEVLSGCPYAQQYDLVLGTSDRGDTVDTLVLPDYEHALIVFGGVKGLEYSLDNDPDLTVDAPADLFDFYVNTCPRQGSRTIRTEEAVLISLAAFRPALDTASGNNSAASSS